MSVTPTFLPASSEAFLPRGPRDRETSQLAGSKTVFTNNSERHRLAAFFLFFESYRTLLPLYDICLSALITDLYERGLHQDVCVVVWGEFGRTPRINKYGGRDHWPAAGSVLFSGGGLKMGQYVGATGPTGEDPITRPYTPQNILATLYHVLGIDPSATIPDLNGRPQYVLDDREPVTELI